MREYKKTLQQINRLSLKHISSSILVVEQYVRSSKQTHTTHKHIFLLVFL